MGIKLDKQPIKKKRKGLGCLIVPLVIVGCMILFVIIVGALA